MSENPELTPNDNLFNEIVEKQRGLAFVLSTHLQAIADYKVESQTTVPIDRYEQAVEFFRQNGLSNYIDRIQPSQQGEVE
jgi:hypothetical protein